MASNVVNIPEQLIDQHLFPDVQRIGDRHVRAARAIKAIQATARVVFSIPIEGSAPKKVVVEVGEWLCRIIDTDDYFTMPDDLFQLLFELPSSE